MTCGITDASSNQSHHSPRAVACAFLGQTMTAEKAPGPYIGSARATLMSLLSLDAIQRILTPDHVCLKRCEFRGENSQKRESAISTKSR
jgi:hypothetical protein